MEHKVLRTAEKLQKLHTKKHWLYRGLSVLAAGAVFCTTYALILPAITLDKDPICGIEAHTHTDECYTAEGTWECMTDPEIYELLSHADYVAHKHEDNCYDEDGELICPFADWGAENDLPEIVEPHEHTDECYEITVHTHTVDCTSLVQGELICALEEEATEATEVAKATSPELVAHVHDETCIVENKSYICGLEDHIHNDDCRDSEGNIVCGMEEHTHEDTCVGTTTVYICGFNDGDLVEVEPETVEEPIEPHVHDETCYSYEMLPTCGFEEGAETRTLICDKLALHQHTDECYEDGVLICDLPEVILHQHEDCYTESEPILTCEKEVHEHTDDCYGTYEEVPGMTNVTLASSGEHTTPDLPDKDTLTGNWADDLVTVAKSQDGKVSSLFGAWYTETYEDVATNDQAFISWCLHTVGITDDMIPYSTDAESFYTTADALNILQDGTPELGDIVIDECGESYIVGIYVGTSGLQQSVMYGDLSVMYGGDGIVGEDMHISPVAHISISELYEKYNPEEPVEPDNPDNPEEDAGEGILDSGYDQEVLRALLNSTWFEDHYTHLLALEEDENDATTGDSTTTTTTKPSDSQIDSGKTGSEGTSNKNTADGVYVEKSIDGTDTENVFDITLRVETNESLDVEHQDPDMAVVIVVDISGTMLNDFSGGEISSEGLTTKEYEAKINEQSKFASAWNAVDKFVEKFNDEASGNISHLGIVAFNTDAYQVHTMDNLSSYSSFMQGAYTNLRGIMTKADVKDDNHPNKPDSYTNMEGGLQMAQDMLKTVTNKNKFVILLSDGLPTTYLPADDYKGTDGLYETNYITYNGYNPVMQSYTGTKTLGIDGVFGAKIYENKKNNANDVFCLYGVNYSNTGAIKARKVAENMKNDGVDIYTVGIGLSSFSGSANMGGSEPDLNAKEFIENQLKRAKNCFTNYRGEYYQVNVVDFYKDYDGNVIYDEQSTDSTVDDVVVSLASKMEVLSNGSFENWLRYRIGSGKNGDESDLHFIEPKDGNALVEAFTDIFQKLSDITTNQWTEAWVVTDPVPDEFSYLGVVSTTPNKDEWKYATNTLSWDLKKADETTPKTDYKYAYTITYRVRLKNEADGFVENNTYNTNGTTILSYRVTKTVNGSASYKNGTITFPIPSVHGYLGELKLTKVSKHSDTDDNTKVLSDVKFTLKHYDKCTLCKLNGECVMTDAELQASCMNQEGTTDTSGVIHFKNLPSGHIYILHEVEETVPAGHRQASDYLVYIQYDRVTVKKLDDGTEVWKDGTTDADGTFTPNSDTFYLPNYTSYQLPQTGGSGTKRYILSGVVLMGMSVMLYTMLYTVRRRKRE